MTEQVKDIFDSIDGWFGIAKPNHTVEDACIQTGCHYEEVAEMALALGDSILSGRVSKIADDYKNVETSYIDSLESLSNEKKVEDLDSICDQMVTLIGRARFMGYDLKPALEEVNASNYSKFEKGVPVFNEQGKIAKGKDFFRPDLTKFINKE